MRIKQFHNFTKIYLLIIFTIILTNCKTSTDVVTPAVENKNLVSANLLGSFTKEDLIKRATDLFGGSNANPLVLNLIQTSIVKSSIKAYKVIYKTKNWDGSEIQASGCLLVPQTTDALAMISQQHGTIRTDAEAPSNYGPSSEAYSIGSIFASNGFIISCPDYIGYGTSLKSGSTPYETHPYEHRASLAQASLDMTRASVEFIKQEKINWNKKLMITGYSQGGFATMSLQKKIEEEFPTEFNLVASSCGAGAYNKTEFMKFLITKDAPKSIIYNSTFIWVTRVYDKVYKLNRPLTDYFKEPYATEIQKNGLNADLKVGLNNIFTDAFKKGVMDGTDTKFLDAVKDNDIFDWKPKTPTRLYHGDADPLVFYFNSETAFKAMTAKGATNIEFFTTKGGDHATTIQDYFLGTFSFFGEKR
jgi:pimeloyl-ACP methyl ester carboxylesterase